MTVQRVVRVALCAALLGVVPISVVQTTPSKASHQCTAAQERASAAYFDENGKKRPDAKGPMIKWCSARKVANPYPELCSKPGFGVAVDYVQRAWPWINVFLDASDEVYGAYTEHFGPLNDAQVAYARRIVRQSGPHGSLHPEEVGPAPVHPAGGSKYAVVAKGEREVRGVDAITLPEMGQTLFYEDRAALITFSLTMLPPTPSTTPGVDPSADDERNLVIAFRGTIPFEASRDVVGADTDGILGQFGEPHLRAELVAQEIGIALIRKGQQCTTTIAYTGHSLGGGLAWHAGTMVAPRCSTRRTDAIIVFNPARPRGKNMARSLRAVPSNTNKIVLFATQMDGVKWAHAVRLWGEARADRNSPYRILKMDNMDSGLNASAVVMAPITGALVVAGLDHTLGYMRKAFSLVGDMPRPPARIPDQGVRKLCEAYTP